MCIDVCFADSVRTGKGAAAGAAAAADDDDD
jgi:hypothetical protein